MIGFNIFTHEMPSAFEFIRPYIFAQHPNLEDAHIPQTTKDNYAELMAASRNQYGAEFSLDPIYTS